jgi:sugar phosphate isomerase/epimerase
MMAGEDAPLLAFSTLGCPEWDAGRVVVEAARIGFGGIEWRGGPAGTVRTDWSGAQREGLRRAVADSGLRSIAVTAYSNLISGDAGVRTASVAALVEHLRLAADLGAPWVRAFVGIADDEAPPDELAERAIDGLAAALDATLRLPVGLALEPHDDHVLSSSLAPILAALPGPGLGVVWEIGNAWAAGEDPAIGIAGYAGRIAWVQVKDGTGRGGTWQLCPLGAGDVPLRRALGLLAVRSRELGRPMPPVSFEWERAWHPDLDPPEQALPAAYAWLRDAVTGTGDPVR